MKTDKIDYEDAFLKEHQACVDLHNKLEDANDRWDALKEWVNKNAPSQDKHGIFGVQITQKMNELEGSNKVDNKKVTTICYDCTVLNCPKHEYLISNCINEQNKKDAEFKEFIRNTATEVEKWPQWKKDCAGIKTVAYRPYKDASEVPFPLCVKFKVPDKSENHYGVVAAWSDDGVYIAGEDISFQMLFDNFVQHNGKPCGVKL